MASTTIDRIYETFAEISGTQDSLPEALTTASQELAETVDTASKTIETASQGAMWSPSELLTGVMGTYTPASTTTSTIQNGATSTEGVASTLLSNALGEVPLAGAILGATGSTSSNTQNSGGGIGSTLESVATTVLKSGFGVIPLVGDLLGLFGGGDSSTAETTLTKYSPPSAINFEGVQTATGLASGDYDQFGMPRVYANAGSGSQGQSIRAANAASDGNASPGAQQITVNIQAMDARSFLDRSSDIAAAVRDAMLNLNSINDVVSDL